MPYQQSLDIERRLEAVLTLIRAGKYSTPAIAEKIGVSIPTVSRCVEALRERGHEICAVRNHSGWRYVLKAARGPRATRRTNHSSREPAEVTA